MSAGPVADGRTRGRLHRLSLAGLHARLANPLASKELLARMRGPRTFIIATTLLLPLAGVAALIYSMIAGSTSVGSSSEAMAGKLYFAAVSIVELGLICLLAPALSADLISGERERRTLDLLLVTPLSRRQIVVGKLVAALASLLTLVVLALPIQAVAVIIGGVEWHELAVGLLILLLAATTYGCVGLFWSASVRSTRGALLLSYVSTLAAAGGIPLLLLLVLASGGLFGSRSLNTALWPITWLVSGPGAVSGRLANSGAGASGPSAVSLHMEGAVGQLLIASNPLLAGITSAAALVEGRPVLAIEQVASTDLLYVAPWLLFTVVHLLAAVVLIWLTARALRRMTA